MNRNLTAGLDTPGAAKVRFAYSQALAYVWGRQDAGEDERDTALSERFAEVFAKHVRDFVLGRSCWQTNLQSAYEHWIKTGEIDV